MKQPWTCKKWCECFMNRKIHPLSVSGEGILLHGSYFFTSNKAQSDTDLGHWMPGLTLLSLFLSSRAEAVWTVLAGHLRHLGALLPQRDVLGLQGCNVVGGFSSLSAAIGGEQKYYTLARWSMAVISFNCLPPDLEHLREVSQTSYIFVWNHCPVAESMNSRRAIAIGWN